MNIFSKILIAGTTAMLLTTSASAKFNYKEHCPNLNDRVVKSFSSNVLNKENLNSNQGEKYLKRFYKTQVNYIKKETGVGSKIKLNSYTYDLDKFFISVDKYIIHTYNRYLKEGDKNLLYKTMGYMVRPDKDTYSGMKKRGFLLNVNLLQSFMTVRKSKEFSDGKFGAGSLALRMWGFGNQSKLTGVGYKDPKYLQFYSLLMKNKFNEADKLIEKSMHEKFKDLTVGFCYSMAYK